MEGRRKAAARAARPRDREARRLTRDSLIEEDEVGDGAGVGTDLVEEGRDRGDAAAGIAAGGGAEACQAAERGGDADRALGVFGEAERGHARGDRRGGAAAGAAGDAGLIVGITHGAEGGVVAGPAAGKLVQVGLAEGEGAGGAKAC